jgi:hypothetical protein
MKRLLSRFLTNIRGVSTLEFAILTPVALLSLTAVVAFYGYLRNSTDLDRVTFTIGNLVTQQATLINDATDTNSADIGVYWSLAPLAALPLDLKDNGTVIITDIYDSCTEPSTQNCTPPVPAVAWQKQPTAWGQGDSSKVAPDGVLNPAQFPLVSNVSFNVGDSTMVVEVFYHYTPWKALSLFWNGGPSASTPLYDVMFIHPRYTNPNPLQ